MSCTGERKNSFGKAHVLPCVPSLIQLQEPCTGRIMSRRRATSGKVWDHILDLPGALINQRH
jgi:hypothetical protein